MVLLASLAASVLVCAVGGLLMVLVAMSAMEEGGYAVLTASDELEFAAIKAIHWHLDDNADGTVDFSESDKFVHTELHESSEEKSHRFHETGQAITSEDLWRTWHNNKVFEWTNDDVIAWLENYVELPQYSDLFRKHNITGRLLPSVANNTRQILQTVLQISDGQHRQKIQLRAMDVVLFGPPSGGYSSYWKDAVLVFSTTFCLVGLFYALRQRQVAQARIDTFLKNIQVYEKELSELKEKLELQEKGEESDGSRENSPGEDVPSSSPELESVQPEEEEALSEAFSRLDSCSESSLQRAQQEVEALRRRVGALETQLRDSHTSHGTLQSLLQVSHHREWEHLDSKKRIAEEEVTKAHKACDKIKRRSGSLLGTFRLANSSTLEDAGLQITIAVNKMQKISNDLNEFHKRWRKIEQVAGFAITTDTSPPHPLPHVTSAPHFTQLPGYERVSPSATPTSNASYGHVFSLMGSHMSLSERRDSDSSSSATSVSEGVDRPPRDVPGGRTAAGLKREPCVNRRLLHRANTISTIDSSMIPDPSPGLKYQNETHSAAKVSQSTSAPLLRKHSSSASPTEDRKHSSSASLTDGTSKTLQSSSELRQPTWNGSTTLNNCLGSIQEDEHSRASSGSKAEDSLKAQKSEVQRWHRNLKFNVGTEI